jgi:hypothetical protein
MDAMAVFAALDTDLFAWVAEAVASGDRPFVAAPKKTHNKTQHRTDASGKVSRRGDV